MFLDITIDFFNPEYYILLNALLNYKLNSFCIIV